MMNGENLGRLLVTAAYVSWGLLPIYWHALADLAPEAVLLQRTIWSAVTLAAIMRQRQSFGRLKAIVKNRAALSLLALSSLLLAVNWLTYLWAMAHGKMVAASMGYFISPVLSILLGVIFLREPVSAVQRAAVCLMIGGVLTRMMLAGEPPWLALLLAASFSSYALVRKLAGVDAVAGLFVEVLVMIVPAVAIAFASAAGGSAALWSESAAINALLVLSGIVTVLPLLWLVRGAQLVSLGFVGATQYLAPTLMFLIAVMVYGEPVEAYDLMSLPLIWIAAGAFVCEPGLRRLLSQLHGAKAAAIEH